MILVQAAKLIGAGMEVSVISGAGVGIGTVLGALINAVSRNPGLTNQLFSYAILGFALTEAIALFGLMMSFLILGSFFNLTWLGTDSITLLGFFIWIDRPIGTPDCLVKRPIYIVGKTEQEQTFFSLQFSSCRVDQDMYKIHHGLFYGLFSSYEEDTFLSILFGHQYLKTAFCPKCKHKGCEKKPTVS